MRVKICGLTSREDSMAAARFGADALGFNFTEEGRSKGRYIEPALARDIVAELPAFVSSVAVTINAERDTIDAYLEFTDYIQLHGEESPELALASTVVTGFVPELVTLRSVSIALLTETV